MKHKHKPNECIPCSLFHLFGSLSNSLNASDWISFATSISPIETFFFFCSVGLTRYCPNSRDLCGNSAGWVDKRHYAYLFHRCTTLNLMDSSKLISQAREKSPKQWFFLFDNRKSTEMNWCEFDSIKLLILKMLICCNFLLVFSLIVLLLLNSHVTSLPNNTQCK